MESQGKYDFAIYGEGLTAWIAALLLAKQGERVLIMPENRDRRGASGRILFGLEPGGILLRILERWGISSTVLSRHSHGRMECLTPDSSLWLQGSLTEKVLGAPGFELGGRKYEQLLGAVKSMEDADEWKREFAQEWVERIRRTTDRRLSRVPFLPNTARSWKRVVRKILNPKVRGIKMPLQSSGSDSTVGLLQGLDRLLDRDEAKTHRAPSGLQVIADLFALRNAYFADEIFLSLKEEFRRVLAATGVEFLPDTIYPEFKRDSTGSWEGFYESGKKGLALFRFDHLVFTRQLEPDSLKRFEGDSKKVFDPDFQRDEFDRYELEIRFKENPFPFFEPAELVSRSPSGGWVRFSVYQTPESSVRVRALIPVKSGSPVGTDRPMVERRLLREIRESLPGLAIDSEHSVVSTEVHRERRFRPALGVKGATSRIWHAHEQSFPQMGEYGPIIAAIEIARLRARKKRIVLPI